MTKEELREHCEKQVKICEMLAEHRCQEPSGKIYEEHKLILDLIKALEQQASEDCVSMGVYKQVTWERDIAIEQLKELGYSFGEKIRTSDDCVSRADLLKLYEDRFIELQKAHQQDKQLGVNWCINTLKEMPPVTPTQSWIPVSEKLPEVGEKVLCQCQANIYDVLKLTADGWYYDNRHCYMSGFVIAWQPLPKPYEEKRGNENGSN